MWNSRNTRRRAGVATHKPDVEWTHMKGLEASHPGDPSSEGQGLPLVPPLPTHIPACHCSLASGPMLGMQTSPGLCPSFLYQELRTKQGASDQGAWKREARGPGRVTAPVLLDRLTPWISHVVRESGSSSRNLRWER